MSFLTTREQHKALEARVDALAASAGEGSAAPVEGAALTLTARRAPLASDTFTAPSSQWGGPDYRVSGGVLDGSTYLTAPIQDGATEFTWLRGSAALVVRAAITDNDNDSLVLSFEYGSSIRLAQRVGGAEITLGSASITPGARLRVTFSGPDIRVYVSGTLVIQASSPASVRTGYLKFYLGPTGTAAVDDFALYAEPDMAPLTVTGLPSGYVLRSRSGLRGATLTLSAPELVDVLDPQGQVTASALMHPSDTWAYATSAYDGNVVLLSGPALNLLSRAPAITFDDPFDGSGPPDPARYEAASSGTTVSGGQLRPSVPGQTVFTRATFTDGSATLRTGIGAGLYVRAKANDSGGHIFMWQQNGDLAWYNVGPNPATYTLASTLGNRTDPGEHDLTVVMTGSTYVLQFDGVEIGRVTSTHATSGCVGIHIGGGNLPMANPTRLSATGRTPAPVTITGLPTGYVAQPDTGDALSRVTSADVTIRDPQGAQVARARMLGGDAWAFTGGAAAPLPTIAPLRGAALTLTTPGAGVTRAVVSTGKPYVLSVSPSSNYPDSGGELTNGARPAPPYSESGWTGFNVPSVTVTLDLGVPTFVDTVRAYSLGGGAGGIGHPELISAEVGDGVTWQSLGSAAPSDPLAGSTTRTDAVTGDGQLGQYVRVTLTRRAGMDWMFIGEIEVERGELPATVTGLPTGYQLAAGSTRTAAPRVAVSGGRLVSVLTPEGSVAAQAFARPGDVLAFTDPLADTPVLFARGAHLELTARDPGSAAPAAVLGLGADQTALVDGQPLATHAAPATLTVLNAQGAHVAAARALPGDVWRLRPAETHATAREALYANAARLERTASGADAVSTDTFTTDPAGRYRLLVFNTAIPFFWDGDRLLQETTLQLPFGWAALTRRRAQLDFSIDVTLLSDPGGRQHAGVFVQTVDGAEVTGFRLVHLDNFWYASRYVNALETNIQQRPSGALNLPVGVTRRLRVLVDFPAGSVQLFVNGTECLAFTDKSFAAGRPGGFGYAGKAAWDNLSQVGQDAATVEALPSGARLVTPEGVVDSPAYVGPGGLVSVVDATGATLASAFMRGGDTWRYQPPALIAPDTPAPSAQALEALAFFLT